MTRDGDKAEAVKTAGERLEAIERWSRLSAEMTVVGVAILFAIACGFAYVGLDYLAMKRAAAEMSRQFVDERLKAGGHKPLFSPVARPAQAGR